jgi:DNA-binding NarL/FixJ family response regulator
VGWRAEKSMSETRKRWTLAAIGVVGFGLLLAVEHWTEDEPQTLADFLGDATQTALVVATSVAVALLAVRVDSDRAERRALARELELARADGEAWRRQASAHVEGLGHAIEAQFSDWHLTAAEREIGVLMLKGLVHKEIASLRGTSEATVRHQARAIYQKAGIEGRAAFCAFFLEDLLPASVDVATND